MSYDGKDSAWLFEAVLASCVGVVIVAIVGLVLLLFGCGAPVAESTATVAAHPVGESLLSAVAVVDELTDPALPDVGVQPAYPYADADDPRVRAAARDYHEAMRECWRVTGSEGVDNRCAADRRVAETEAALYRALREARR